MKYLRILKTYYTKFRFFIKLIFFGSILVFVSNQFTSILSGMSLSELGDKMRAVPSSKLVLIFLSGLAGSLLLMTYDYAAQKALVARGQSVTPLKTWLPQAFIVNSINNLVGFGGVVGASLRQKFYKKELSGTKVLATVSKLAFFMLSGLSVLAWIGLALIIFTPVADYFKQYWFWLAGVGLYGPALVFFSYLKRKTLFADYYPWGVARLVVASLGQWLGAFFAFSMIGVIVGWPIHWSSLFILFIATSLIGMLTMVPGGAGTFDVLMIIGLTQMGVNHEAAVLWLLFYRLSYYIVPFLLGGIAFVHRTGVKANQMFDGLPKLLGRKLAHGLLTGAVYFAGITMVLLSTVTNLSNTSRLFSTLLPYSFDFLDQTLNMAVGIILLGLARGVANKVQRAYLPTLLVLAFGIINTISRTSNWRLIVVYVLILGLVYFSRKEFYRQKLVYSFGAATIDIVLVMCLTILYSVAGYFSTAGGRGEIISGHFILFPSADVWLKGMLGLGFSLVVFVTLLFYLMQGPTIGVDYNAAVLDNLTEKYGAKSQMAPVHRLTLKNYFYHGETGTVVFSFEKKLNKLFVFGNPVGPGELLRPALTEFINEADILGYQLAFFQVSGQFIEVLHDYGFDYLKIGEEGFVTAMADKAAVELIPGTRYQAFYTPDNKLERHWQKQAVLQDIDFELRAPFVILTHDDKLVAVLNFNYNQKKRRIYLCDYWGIDEQTEISFLNSYVSEALSKGYTVDIGLLPLANVGLSRFSFVTERLVQFGYRYGFGNSQLKARQLMKENLVTYSKNRYLAYRKNANPVVALGQLFFLIRRKKSARKPLVEQIFPPENPTDD